MLADMATSIEAARALYLEAARRKDAGLNFTSIAAMAKLMATDSAMKVTTDAIQVFGGAGYTRDFPVERFFREAKVLQIVEGTNQVQRMVIGRSLGRGELRGPRFCGTFLAGAPQVADNRCSDLHTGLSLRLCGSNRHAGGLWIHHLDRQ